MRILLLSHRFPFPPTDGARIRPFHMLRHLAREHEVTVASHYRSAQERERGQGLEEICGTVLAEEITPAAALWRMGRRFLGGEPVSMGYFHSPRLARRIRAELAARRYDLILAYCSSIAPYVADVEGPVKMRDFADMDSQKWLAYARALRFPLSAGYRLEGTRLRRAEEELARKFDVCTCTTAAEVETLDGYGTGVRSAWFTNGADLDYFRPSAGLYDPDRITFVGRMDYFPNAQCMVAFCRDVLPLIRARRPGVTLTIVGASPSRAVRKLARIPGVTVTGRVPDVRPYVHDSALTVAPLAIARGVQNKIVESLAMGVPCLASEIAGRGVDCVPGEHLLTASTPEGYAAQALRVLEDPEERRRLAAAGRARVETHHTWERSMRMLDAILEETCAVAADQGST